MKRFALLIVLIILLSANVPKKVTSQISDIGWGRVIEDDTYFYTLETEESAKFIIPKSYYVKLLSESENFYAVEYFDGEDNYLPVKGYVKKNLIYRCDYTPENPFYKQKLEITADSVIYANKNLTSRTAVILCGSEARYYGEIPSNYGELLYYVLYGDVLGYIKAPCVTTFSVTEHSDPMPEIKKPDEAVPVDANVTEEQQSGTPEENEGTQIIVIAVLCLLSLVIVCFMFRPVKQKSKNYYDDVINDD